MREQIAQSIGAEINAEINAEMPATVVDPSTEAVYERLYRIIILNDDVTPFGYVILMLEGVFDLSLEMAEHVALMAHTKGSAIVRICPKPEAEKLVARAHSQAQRDGFPLAFDLQPE